MNLKKQLKNRINPGNIKKVAKHNTLLTRHDPEIEKINLNNFGTFKSLSSKNYLRSVSEEDKRLTRRCKSLGLTGSLKGRMDVQ